MDIYQQRIEEAFSFSTDPKYPNEYTVEIHRTPILAIHKSDADNIKRDFIRILKKFARRRQEIMDTQRQLELSINDENF